jgi:hypothetical protein
MAQRTTVGTFKTGSITLGQARAAVRAVKLAKEQRLAARKTTANPKTSDRVNAALWERYLGHFGGRVSKTSQTGTKVVSGVKKGSSAASREKKPAPKQR